MDKTVLVLVLVLGTLVGTLIAVAFLPLEFGARGQSRLMKFSSYQELKDFVNASRKASSHETQYAPQLLETYGLRSQASVDYSATNIQVEGVDEADFVKTDGEYIYVGLREQVTTLKAYPVEEAEILSHIRLSGTLMGIFINEDKLVILEQNYRSYEASSSQKTYGVGVTSTKVYDIADRINPNLVRNVSLDGHYSNSRMIANYVYILANHPVYSYQNKVTLPEICVDGKAEEIQASTIYYSDVSGYSYTCTTVLAVNVEDPAQEPTHETFLFGATRNLYVSVNNIYITLHDTTIQSSVLPLQGVFSEVAELTAIHKIHIEEGEIECVASGEVPGYVLNQFSMDEYNGYFRIATTTGHIARTFDEATSQNHVYVLDTDLRIIGELENLAPGETVYSARFMGDRCYLVTFRKIDPLFVIDLERPRYPRVLGQLKITGYSDYLHPYDEDHIIGIGKETVAAKEGDFAWYQGVKISLFDVTDVSEPNELAKYEIGDRGTDSPVLHDHKALLFDKSKRLVVLPVSVAEIDESKYPDEIPPNAYGDHVWQGIYVFDVSLEQGLVLKGRITHLEEDIDPSEGGYYSHSSYHVVRSLYIDNVLYSISSKKIKMNSLEDLGEINEIMLP